MIANKTRNPISGNFDLCFQGFNLSGAVLAMSALQYGLKVAIIIDQPLNWNFEPEMVTLYPLKFKQLFQSVRRIKNFEKISSIFPSLVYPQRILTVSEGRKFRTKKISSIDLFLKRDREIASLPINFSKFPSFQIMANYFQNGLLVQEFRFDRNKAIIEMLQMCRNLGASIFSDPEWLQGKIDASCVFTCLPIQNKAAELKIENFQFSFANNIRIETKDFEITTQVLKSTTCLHFGLKRKIGQDVFLSQVRILLKSIGIESSEMLQNEMKSIYTFIEQNTFHKHVNKQQLSDHEISAFKTNIKKDEKRISKTIGKKIGLKKLIRFFKSNRFDGTGFRQLQTECDEKFDLAKQTGIDYERFSYFFYRYHTSIDELIELAYQKMNDNRNNPQLLWENVEREFIEHIEKEIFS